MFFKSFGTFLHRESLRKTDIWKHLVFSNASTVDISIQEVYLCTQTQLMEMVLVHILFLQHLKRLCKIHLTAGWEHSCRERRTISTQALLLLLLRYGVKDFSIHAVSSSLFFQVNNAAPNHFLHRVGRYVACQTEKDVKSVRPLAGAADCLPPPQWQCTHSWPKRCGRRRAKKILHRHHWSVNTDDLFHTFSSLFATLLLPSGLMPLNKRYHSETRKTNIEGCKDLKVHRLSHITEREREQQKSFSLQRFIPVWAV